MTQRELLRKVKVWNKRLGLQEWTIDIYIEKTSEEIDGDASITPSREYNKADLQFATEFTEWDDAYAEKVVVHELTHLLTNGILSVGRDVASNNLGNEANRAVQAWFVTEDERQTVRLTKLFLKSFGPA
jgi:hypothetical protein